ncbi:acyl-CoA dehydrogenase family protein [Pseudonocardia asaccharolytica]|nr:acyl-CoA dehydrogenase family protein [Pseudonocardia asaccharolytica]
MADGRMRGAEQTVTAQVPVPRSNGAESDGAAARPSSPTKATSAPQARPWPVAAPVGVDLGTHEVLNQVPPLAGYDPLACDPALVDAVRQEGAADALDDLAVLGRTLTTEQAREDARLANENSPVLRTHDRYGHRIDEVEFHPSWHRLMALSVGWGLHGAPWQAEPGSGAHVARAAGFYLVNQLEQGHCCPISMTYAAIPALRHDPDLAARFEPGLMAREYQPGLARPDTKSGLLAGMSMTEKQGGSDVRAGTTVAAARSDGTYELIGHKWFTSAPMNDLFLTLAQAPGGLTCFVLPRVLPDGSRNPIRLQRLKDKLGNRSNASAELEYDGAIGWRLGDEGRGVATIIEMVSMTRLDCVLGSAAIMRAALTEAAHHVAHRSAFGLRLADTPLMQTVIADLALESEAATSLALRLAGATDRGERELLRLALPASKYLVCKRTPAVVAEALECLGGNGYVEDSGLPRLYREAPLNSIWEGSGNVTALDVLRAVIREPDSVDAVLAEIDAATGTDEWFDRGVRELRTELRSREERRARRLAEMLALCLQGSLLLRRAPEEVASAFVSSRFLPDGPWRTAGTLPAEAHARALLQRITPT